MTEELLPPDPSKDGWYWVKQSDVGPDPWQWLSGHRKWAVAAWTITPEEAARIGALASPHPIPTPEQLNALCEMRDALSQGADEIRSVSPETASAWGTVVRELDDLFGGKPAPNDPPGNGLGDIRAAAMDQWDVPRAGEETAP